MAMTDLLNLIRAAKVYDLAQRTAERRRKATSPRGAA